MKKIDRDNKIFMSMEFQKDIYKFHIITMNLNSKTLELISDEENYLMCRGTAGYPTWIWTKDNFNVDLLPEIKQGIRCYLTGSKKDKFTCKKELYDLLKKDHFENLNDDYFEMGFLLCEKTRETKPCDGFMDKPDPKDLQLLTKYWYEDSHEMNGVVPVSMERAEEDIRKLYASEKFYVWRNNEGNIVSMASYNEAGDGGKLGHVYTPKEERQKGYAASLIKGVTELLLAKGLVPLLYTDYNYIPSNRAYINAGYEDKGILINFSCH